MSTRAPSRDDVAALVAGIERDPRLPSGVGERFAGYGVMAAPFQSGHVLAMRRFPASSLGHGYSSVWHRTPDGQWTFYADRPPLEACPRYFGSALERAVTTPVTIHWPTPRRLEIDIPSAELRWSLELEATIATRLMNTLAAVMPERWWHSASVLGVMARLAGPLLGAGQLGLSGHAPNGQRFVANPMKIWAIGDCTASIAGRDLGPPGPLAKQVRLGDFVIPQRGLFAIGRAFFEPADVQQHRLVADRRAGPQAETF